jgi:hypothetical protein
VTVVAVDVALAVVLKAAVAAKLAVAKTEKAAVVVLLLLLAAVVEDETKTAVAFVVAAAEFVFEQVVVVVALLLPLLPHVVASLLAVLGLELLFCESQLVSLCKLKNACALLGHAQSCMPGIWVSYHMLHKTPEVVWPMAVHERLSQKTCLVCLAECLAEWLLAECLLVGQLCLLAEFPLAELSCSWAVNSPFPMGSNTDHNNVLGLVLQEQHVELCEHS